MGCNCKVNKDLEILHEKFGYTVDPSFKDLFKFKMENTLQQIFMPFFTLAIIPLLFSYVAFERHRGNDKISITDFFLDRSKHVTNQQFN